MEIVLNAGMTLPRNHPSDSEAFAAGWPISPRWDLDATSWTNDATQKWWRSHSHVGEAFLGTSNSDNQKTTRANRSLWKNPRDTQKLPKGKKTLSISLCHCRGMLPVAEPRFHWWSAAGARRVIAITQENLQWTLPTWGTSCRELSTPAQKTVHWVLSVLSKQAKYG